MGKVSKGTTTEHYELPGFEGHYSELEGYTVGFERYDQDSDPADLFKGLPNDHCQSPHWGVVLEGSYVLKYEDGTEDVIGPGEAYYCRPGHLPVLKAGTEIVEFSPTAELAKTMEVITRNLEAAQASG